MNIEPASGAGAAPSIHVERRRVYGFPRAGELNEEHQVRPYDNRPAKDPFLIWVPEPLPSLNDEREHADVSLQTS